MYNAFTNNTSYAISVFNEGHVHHNNFFFNNPDGRSQAYCSSLVTKWYDSSTLEGNYRSDWDGEGAYEIYTYSSHDLFPLSEPVVEIPEDFLIPWEVEEPTDTTFFLLSSVIVIFCLTYMKKKRKYNP